MTGNRRHEIEVADLFRQCWDGLKGRHRFTSVQHRAVSDIMGCRTSNAGGHVSRCSSCGHSEQSYNSCRNRHCPKCQFIRQLQWVDRLKGRMLPGRYFHVVFTVPSCLHGIFYSNQRTCYDLLFHASKQALLQAGRNSGFLGADTGAVSVLHTWGQQLTYHPHVHMMVPAGGLDEDMQEWVPSPKKFFVPVRALSSMFRGIFMRGLREAWESGSISLPDGHVPIEELKQPLYRRPWNVYSKHAFGGLNSVLEYLGRYTHRVAVSNSRLLSASGGEVAFRYKDYRSGGRQKVMRLSTGEFCRRFLQHILPPGYCKVRYYGILATAHIHTKREQAMHLLGGGEMWMPRYEGLSGYEVLKEVLGEDPLRCRVCKKGIMTGREKIVQRE